MSTLFHVVTIFSLIFLLLADVVRTQCADENSKAGIISQSYTIQGSEQYNYCWRIRNPIRHKIRLEVKQFNFYQKGCDQASLKIKDIADGREVIFCDNGADKALFFSNSDVEVHIFFNSDSFQSYYHRNPSFELHFEVETGIEKNDESLKAAIQLMKAKYSPLWGWRENTLKAVTALRLADGATFHGTDLDEELMVKQAEIKVLVSLIRNETSNEDLSMFINSLLVTCQNPRQFYGEDLVKRLVNQLELSGNFTHPASYLALCNANVAWPERAVSDLISILSTDTDFPFVIDIQSYAVMAIACNINKYTLNSTETDIMVSLYKYTIEQFKERQYLNGSFGNFYLTAVLTQALLASGEEFSVDWNAREALTYITENLFYPHHYDFQFLYLALPLLNKKTFADISNINCRDNPRNKDDLVSEISHYLGEKMEVKYSLFVGKEKDITHTMSFQVPQNFTAYEVMKLAEMQNQNFNFNSEMSFGRLYVYAISGIPNDPEAGKVWLLYLGPKSKRPLTLINKGPDELVLENEDHVIMWYRRTQI